MMLIVLRDILSSFKMSRTYFFSQTPQSKMTKQEIELSSLQAIVKMATRQALEEKKIGKTIYAFALYEKLKRATIPLMDEKDHILLISFELQADHENIILHKILPLVKGTRK
jgi:hypothetical protein